MQVWVDAEASILDWFGEDFSALQKRYQDGKLESGDVVVLQTLATMTNTVLHQDGRGEALEQYFKYN